MSFELNLFWHSFDSSKIRISDEVKKQQELKALEKDPCVAVLEASLETNSLVPATFTSPAQTVKSKRG